MVFWVAFWVVMTTDGWAARRLPLRAGLWVLAVGLCSVGPVLAAPPSGPVSVTQANPAAPAAPSTRVMLDELTASELQARIAAGATTVLVPIGGTEQNGPHMALGKHNRRVLVLATRIAQQLGQTVVAPVIAYVPEGAVNPPTQHMRWTGTISVPEAAFEAVLEGAARSFVQHGFRDVVFLSDHGGYLKNVDRVAAKLNREWLPGSARLPTRQVHALPEYYAVTQTDYVDALKAQGFGPDQIGRHAGLADTSLMLATDPSMVRIDVAAHRHPAAADGVSGDPRRASADLGRLGTERIVEVSVAAISARLRARDNTGGKTNGSGQR